MRIKRYIACLLVLALLPCSLLVPTAAEEHDGMLSLADSVTYTDGSFCAESCTDLYFASSAAPSGELLDVLQLVRFQLLKSGLFEHCGIVYGNKNALRTWDIVIAEDSSIADEAYRIEVSKDNIFVYFGGSESSRGLLYGMQTVNRLLTCLQGQLPAMTLDDAPDTKERALMLDCARKYWSVEWIENLIAQMSWLGYNTLQLHLAEDQGIRADIWSDGSDCNGNDYSFLIGYDSNWNKNYPDPNSGSFYTAKDLQRIVLFAKQYQIGIIPDYDVPPHCDVLTQRYADHAAATPDFSFIYRGVTYSRSGMTADGKTTPYPDGADFMQIRVNSTRQCVDVTNPVARAFALSVVEAYADFFAQLGCTRIHIGCDELNISDADGWDTYAQKNIPGGRTAVDTLVDFINETEQMLKAHGYEDVRVFNDVLYHNGERASSVSLDKDISVCVWNVDKPASVQAIVDEDRQIYNCIQNYCYYVLRYNNEPNGGDARDADNFWWSFHHSTPDLIYQQWNPSKVFNYDADTPIVNNVRGGYFLIWGDFGGYRTEDAVWHGEAATHQYNLIDRLWSNSAKMWAWDAEKRIGWEGFSQMRDAVYYYPGYQDCKSMPMQIEPVEPCTPKTVSLTAQIGTGTKLLCSVAARGQSQETVVLPVIRGYRLLPEGLAITPSDRPDVIGTVTLPEGVDEVQYCNTPDLSELRALLAEKADTADAKYLAAYQTAQALYNYAVYGENPVIWQSVIDRAVDNLVDSTP